MSKKEDLTQAEARHTNEVFSAYAVASRCKVLVNKESMDEVRRMCKVRPKQPLDHIESQ